MATEGFGWKGFQFGWEKIVPRGEMNENAADEWRAYSDGLGDLHVFCPECAE